jgi:hypothetical protein
MQLASFRSLPGLTEKQMYFWCGVELDIHSQRAYLPLTLTAAMLAISATGTVNTQREPLTSPDTVRENAVG